MTDLTTWGCSKDAVNDEYIKKTRREHREKFAFLQDDRKVIKYE